MIILRRSHNLCRSMLFNQTLNQFNHKNSNLLRKILNSFVHTINTERIITRKVEANR
jgi:hypothetical protein